MVATGVTSSSRLTELRKYTITDVFKEQYVSGGTVSSDGVDYTKSISGVTMNYYLGGINYIDNVTAATTTFKYTPQGVSSPDFISVPMYKNPNKENIISNPKVIDDVFIIRPENSAFVNNYKLEYVQNLVDLVTYAGGQYFKIVNYT